MEVLFLLLFVSFSIALVFLVAFLMAVQKGAFDDLDTPPVRMLQDKSNVKSK